MASWPIAPRARSPVVPRAVDAVASPPVRPGERAVGSASRGRLRPRRRHPLASPVAAGRRRFDPAGCAYARAVRRRVRRRRSRSSPRTTARAACSSSSRTAGSGSSRTASLRRRRSSTSRIAITSGGERGLLGLAFHPGYATDRQLLRRLHRHERRHASSQRSRSTRRTRTGAIRRPSGSSSSGQQPFANHNGGALAFGPDGYLYVAFGRRRQRRRSAAATARTSTTLLGKILRIDVDATGGTAVRDPARQPVRRRAAGAARDLAVRAAQPVALLVRSRDRRPLDRRRRAGRAGRRSTSPRRRGAGGGTSAGTGWKAPLLPPAGGLRPRAGSRCRSPSTATTHGCAVIGGYVYRGTAQPALAGRYLFADYCSGAIWAIDPRDELPRSTVVVGRRTGLARSARTRAASSTRPNLDGTTPRGHARRRGRGEPRPVGGAEPGRRWLAGGGTVAAAAAGRARGPTTRYARCTTSVDDSGAAL